MCFLGDLFWPLSRDDVFFLFLPMTDGFRVLPRLIHLHFQLSKSIIKQMEPTILKLQVAPIAECSAAKRLVL